MFRALIATAATTLAAVGGCSPEPQPRGTADEVALHQLINEVRADHGLDPVSFSGRAQQLGHDRAQAMLADNELQHFPLGSEQGTWVNNGDPDWFMTSEVVGVVYNGPERIVELFLDSPIHRNVVLGRYDVMGVGSVTATDGGWWVSVIFQELDRP